ncbi:MAG: ribonuclease H-like domain-containing protein [Candidatus Acidiferrales bacterium]
MESQTVGVQTDIVGPLTCLDFELRSLFNDLFWGTCQLAVRGQPNPIRVEHSGPLRVIAFSDWRIQDIALLAEEIVRLPFKPDLIVYGGDDISRFIDQGRNWFAELARCSNYGVCAVAGNDDVPGHQKQITGESVFDVHTMPVILGEFAVLGIEGAPSPPGLLLHTEKKVYSHLARQKQLVARKSLILISHCPPRGCLDESVRFSPDRRPRSIGSHSVRRFVCGNKRVKLVICGHSHRCGGRHQKLGQALVVNAASHDAVGNVGRFALITVHASGKAEVQWREIIEVACIPGVKGVSAIQLRSKGIRTAQEFARSDISTLAAAVPSPARPLEILRARARALAQRQPVLISPMKLQSNPEIFLDIETDPDGGYKYVWLIGVCEGRNGRYKAFFANTPAEESRILTAFVEFATQRPTANLLAFSASRFEERVLKKRLSAHSLSMSLCSRIVNLCQAFHNSVALPIFSERVTDIAGSLGFRQRHPDLDGLGVARLYERRYLRETNAARRRKIRKRLLEYNEDDVQSLPFILDAVANLSPIFHQPSNFEPPKTQIT